MGPDLEDDESAAGADHDEEGAATWAPVERELLDAALDFYDAARGVIDYEGLERPHVRRDAAGFDAVRRAMATLETRVLAARAAGVGIERIAEIARMEPEMVRLILQRHDAAPGSSES